MKGFKILIIEDQRGMALALTLAIKKLLLFSEAEIEFIYASSYEEARIKIMESSYDLISLDGYLEDSVCSLPLISTILGMHREAVVFFLSSSTKLCVSAKEAGITLSFLKSFEEILSLDQLSQIKKAMVAKGLISYEILYQELINPMLIFFDTKARDNNFLAITNFLNTQEINFAMVDRNVNRKIFIDHIDSQNLKNIIKTSGLDFWCNWSNIYTYGKK